MFVTGKHFKLSLMFANEALAYLREAPLRVASWPYLQTLDKARKAYQGQTL